MNKTENTASINHSQSKKSKKSIFIVDDCTDMLDLQKTVLELEGYLVYTAQGGNEALKTLSEIEEPDLIILDIQMEDMTGCDLLKIIEIKMPHLVERVPVVFLSGITEVPQSKAIGFIRKPIGIEPFLSAVHNYINFKNISSYKH